MLSEEKITLSKIRLDTAKERLSFADKIFEIGDYKTVANRCYYAIFSAIRAVLALEGYDSKKHSGVISEFRKNYIKTELLPKDLSPIIDGLVEIRHGSDYDDFYIVSEQEVAEQLQNAKTFVSAVEIFLKAEYEKKSYN